MPKNTIRKIIFLGAGNLATNLALALTAKGFEIVQVYNRGKKAGQLLAQKTGAAYISDLKKLSKQADLYIVAISDDSLERVIEQVRVGDKLIVHTSGSMNMNILKSSSENFGVFYPPQTFSKEHPVSFKGVPVCIEANSRKSEDLLRMFALSFTRNVHLVDSDQRKMIHLAAVFANNFTNFMNAISEDLMEKEGLDFGILHPIISQTAANVQYKNLFQLQTGPALREDKRVIENHLATLRKHPEYRKVYDLITKLIIQHKKTQE